MRLIILVVAILTVLLVYTFGYANAATRVCGDRAKITKFLSGKYKEKPRGAGISESGKIMLEVYTSNEGTWTVLMTTPKGVSCIMGAGHSWEDRDMSQYLPKG